MTTPVIQPTSKVGEKGLLVNPPNPTLKFYPLAGGLPILLEVEQIQGPPVNPNRRKLSQGVCHD